MDMLIAFVVIGCFIGLMYAISQAIDRVFFTK